MPNIKITVKNKIALSAGSTEYICGNSDFVIDFDFDAEWDAYETKTARFIYGGSYQDMIFQGSQCAVPVISNTNTILCGVYAGDLHTTTPALIRARKGILCGNSAPADPAPDVYAQMMELINSMGEVDPEAIAAAVAEYMAAHPLEETDPTVPAWAKAETKPTYTAKEVGAIATPDTGNTGEVLVVASASGSDGKPNLWETSDMAVSKIAKATTETIVAAIQKMYRNKKPYIMTDEAGTGDAELKNAFMWYYPNKYFAGSGCTQWTGIAVSAEDGAVYGYNAMLDLGTPKLFLTQKTPDPAFIVSITHDEDTDTYSANHTFTKILAAHEAGRVVQAEYDGAFFALNWIAEDAVTFGATYSADGSELKQDILMISADGSVYLDSVAPTGLPESTTSDAGKFLRVGEDGNAAWETAPSGEEHWLTQTTEITEPVAAVKILLPSPDIRMAVMRVALFSETEGTKISVRIYADKETSAGAENMLAAIGNYYTNAQNIREAYVSWNACGQKALNIYQTTASSHNFGGTTAMYYIDRPQEYLYLVDMTPDTTFTGTITLDYCV